MVVDPGQRMDDYDQQGDEARRKAVDAVFKRWEDPVKDIEKTRDKNRKALVESTRRHDMRPGDLDSIFAEADKIGIQGFDAALDLRFALREELSVDEWRILFAQK